MEDDLKNFKMEDDLKNFQIEDDLKNFKMICSYLILIFCIVSSLF